MRKLLLVAALLTGVAIITPAHAAPLDGNGLNQWCTERDTVMACRGYLLGEWDSMTNFADYAKTAFFCPAGTVTAEQLRMVFINATQTNPAALSLPAPTFVFGAYSRAFPCKDTLQGK